MDAIPRSSTAERRRILFEEARALIEADYGGHVTLDAVARRLATSRRQLQRVMSEVGNTSFAAMLVQVRMARAREALAADEMTVREVAREVGYEQASDFTKAFRRHHGEPPSAYRARHRAGDRAA